MREFKVFAENDKSVLSCILIDFLRAYVADGTTMTKQEMREKLCSLYNINISRNTFDEYLDHIATKCGYALKPTNSKRHDNIKYYFEGNGFTDAQLRVLIDCLINSSIIDNDSAKGMIEELCCLGSNALRKDVSKYQYRLSGKKSVQSSVLENITLIQKAINAGVKISCNYLEYTTSLNLRNRFAENKIMSPFELTLSNGRYILICTLDGEDTFSHFYADKLCDIELTKEPAAELKSIPEFMSFGSMDKYIASQPTLCGGRKEHFTLKVDKTILDEFMNSFGGEHRKVNNHKESDGYSTVIVIETTEDSLRRLMMPYFDRITVLDRPKFDEELKEMVEVGLHNSRMIGKPARIRSFAAITLEEAIRRCVIDGVRTLRYTSRKGCEKIDLTQLEEVDWITNLALHGVDITGQRLPEELKGITSLSLIGCKFDAEMITELKELKDLRITDVTAEQLEAISELENIESIMIDGRARIKDTENSCDIADLSFLKNWSKLKKAELFDLDKLTDISALEDKKGLRLIRIGGCAVSDDAINSLKDKVPSITVYEKTVR